MAGSVFISTAEASADLHAAHAVRALHRRAPWVTVYAAGGDHLRSAGAEVALSTQGHAAMGLSEVLRHLRFYHRLAGDTMAFVAEKKPDVVVLVDASGYHLRLAQRLKRRFPDLPILYYIAPKLWVWHESRIRILRACVRETLCIFPFEEPWFRERGVAARYVGNPTFDELAPHWERRKIWNLSGDRPGKGAFFSPWHTGAERTVTVFPGSRPNEILRMWPCFAETIRRLQNRFDDLVFAIALAPGIDPYELRRRAALPDRTSFVEAEWSQRLLSGSTFALAKSGTCTLEATLLGVPMVVAYRLSRLTGWAAKWTALRGRTHFSLPNILAGREVVPELIQEKATPEGLAEAAGRLLADPEAYAAMRRDLLSLRTSFEGAEAGERTAHAILDYV